MKHIDDAVLLRLQQGLLSGDEEAEVFEHLANCPQCQARYTELVSPRMDALSDLFLPEDFTARTMKRLSSVAPSKTSVTSPIPAAPSPFALRRQRLVAYAIAASLTMALMGSGLFRIAASLPLATPQTATPSPTTRNSWAAKWESFAPLFSPVNLVPGARQPLKIPPLRQLVERSSFHDRKK